MSKETGIFKNYLHSQGLKCTKQRMHIFRAFLSANTHLSVDELYYNVKAHDTAIVHTTYFSTKKVL